MINSIQNKFKVVMSYDKKTLYLITIRNLTKRRYLHTIYQFCLLSIIAVSLLV